jgi:hypothetical protein
MTWSSSDSPSRTEPAAWRAISRTASGVADLLGCRMPVEVLGQPRRRDQLEVEALAARQDGDGNLVDLGGGEDEHHVRRRLLQRLQQRVEGDASTACAPRR